MGFSKHVKIYYKYIDIQHDAKYYVHKYVHVDI
jgi:hypothetical protein